MKCQNAIKSTIPAIIAFLLSPVFFNTAEAQSKAIVTNVDFQVVNDNLIVTYDLLKARKDESFNVRLIVTAVSGKVYTPVTTSGDIGNNVTGGKGKQIKWDIVKDNIYISEEIFVEVKATPTVSAEAATTKTEPVAVKDTERPAPQPPASNRNISKGGAIALSAICPGIGISKMRGGGAHALLCIPVYGAAIGGVVFMLTSNSAYKKYKDATTADDRDKYFDKAKGQQNLSRIFFISAGVIWTANMIWTIATPNRPSPKYSFGATLDPVLGKPMLSFSYKF